VKAFITGITGFVGGHLAEHLLAAGDEVMGLSTSGRWPARTPDELVRTVRLVQGDLSLGETSRSLSLVLRDFAPDCVYHLAAISVPSECGGAEPTPRAIAANVDGTRRVLEWAKELSIRVLVVSTSHIYAQPGSRDDRAREDDPPRPKNAYGKTKWMAERLALEMARAGQVDTVIARAFQHTGPRQGGQMMLPEWAAQLAGSADTINVRNRDTWIDLSDVRDVVRAYRFLIQSGHRGEIYNVGSGVPRRTGDILDQLIKLSGRTVRVAEKTPGERFDAIADIAKLQQATGWRPEVSVEQTVRDVWAWYFDRSR
jgi:GDP-4-dehydro-6-deoxy-D-mannose reductase